jgi:hypothetical protein
MLLAGGVVAPLLFIVVFLIEGTTRPGYSVWRNAVSDLGLSNQGWEQIANFLVCGLLVLGFAVGLRRVPQSGRAAVWGPLLNRPVRAEAGRRRRLRDQPEPGLPARCSPQGRPTDLARVSARDGRGA